MANGLTIDPNYTEEGKLQVNVFNSTIARPVSNASIRITTRGSQNSILNQEISDSSGQGSLSNLAAPPRALSETPESQIQPFSEYDVYVTADGFKPTMVEGVQIFSETIASQNVFLQPVVESTDPNVIVINPPVLWGDFPPKIPEEEVKELPDSSGLVVLPTPVIPEFIIVHDGVPTDASARNYYVPFSDYIKNVASCEIYSTWPEQTIVANVLAILSFTLNRVFTEWYRGKGYGFTITSSTAYDHAFNYGRNIFQEISIVVDSIFNSYITRPGIRQPLLTQYCDGRNVSCPTWMTQWGSKDLGDMGYYAVDILKRFYGQDIYLMNAQKVEGIPVSFPGTNLQVGSTGASVRTIQEQLNAISDNFPAINKIRVDGVFGPQTRTAVETFQSIFDLPSSGIVDFPTWYRISDVYVAVARLAELR